MDAKRETDVMDEVVEEVRRWLPDLDVAGLPITGRILRLARYLEAGREAELAQFGLTLGDFDMLATLRRRAAAEAMKIRDLQLSLMLSSGGTTKRLDRLETAGLIERLPDPNDRRGTLIRLSPTGLELINEAVPAITRYEADVVTSAIGSERSRAVVENGLRQMLIAKESASAEAP
ncbi:MAG: MarR family transcriptional regulator [Acidimicrobiales bacterium]